MFETNRLAIALIALLNTLILLAIIGVVSALQNDVFEQSGEQNVVTPAFCIISFVAATVGLAACWMTFGHVVRWRLSTHDTAHALNILATLFAFLALGYAAKHQSEDPTDSLQTALSALHFILAGTMLLQLILHVLVSEPAFAIALPAGPNPASNP